MADTTPSQVAAMANQADTLALDQLTLIGTYLKPEGDTALLRDADGAISTVSTGQTVTNLTIAAIDETGIMLVDAGGTTHRLSVPGA